MTGTSEQYCPAWGPGSAVCPRDMCDCFIDQFPHDMEQAGALHPEFYRVMPMTRSDRRGAVVNDEQDIEQAHDLQLDGPMRYPGGKDGMYHVVCSCGRYMSPPGTNPDSRRMWEAANRHKASKEALS